jgi:2-polyprenyl-6-methoxyphenol hydroxylase-like FAD-dependent oxidoreductase
MAYSNRGYLGLVRLEDNRLDLGAAFDPAWVKSAGGLGRAAVATLQEAGFPALPGLADLPWGGTPLLTRRASRLAAERAFLLGDAAGYVEPFTGEGIAWALAAARAVAPLARRAVRRWTPALAQEWTRRYRRTVTRRQQVCRIVARVLRHPRLFRGLVTALSWAPGLAAPLVWRLNVAR